ncbi:MAG TPA: hypothetical protein VIC51_05115 [Psychromonas sp.]
MDKNERDNFLFREMLLSLKMKFALFFLLSNSLLISRLALQANGRNLEQKKLNQPQQAAFKANSLAGVLAYVFLGWEITLQKEIMERIKRQFRMTCSCVDKTLLPRTAFRFLIICRLTELNSNVRYLPSVSLR